MSKVCSVVSLYLAVRHGKHCADQQWLDALNSERRAKGLGHISYEVFEIVMDKLEKEWFDLVRDLLTGVHVKTLTQSLR